MLSKNKKNIKMKNCCLYIIMMLLLASCSEQQVTEETSSLQKLTEQKGMTVSPKDSVTSLFNQARWEDSSAYLKLADCYRDGFGVKKDFFSSLAMAKMAEKRGGMVKADDYFCNLPDGHEYKDLFLLINNSVLYKQANADSVMQVLRENDSPEVQLFIGLAMMQQGDTIAAKNIIDGAASQGCSLAETLQICFELVDGEKDAATKLALSAEQMPFVYNLLGDLYYEFGGEVLTDKQLAVEYYLKAEEHAVLDRCGAERVLDYYRNGGSIQLTEDDIKRLELIVQTQTID